VLQGRFSRPDVGNLVCFARQSKDSEPRPQVSTQSSARIVTT